jgi:hypothetical protein
MKKIFFIITTFFITVNIMGQTPLEKTSLKVKEHLRKTLLSPFDYKPLSFYNFKSVLKEECWNDCYINCKVYDNPLEIIFEKIKNGENNFYKVDVGLVNSIRYKEYFLNQNNINYYIDTIIIKEKINIHCDCFLEDYNIEFIFNPKDFDFKKPFVPIKKTEDCKDCFPSCVRKKEYVITHSYKAMTKSGNIRIFETKFTLDSNFNVINEQEVE